MLSNDLEASRGNANRPISLATTLVTRLSKYVSKRLESCTCRRRKKKLDENNASSRSSLAGERKSEEISLFQLPSRIGCFLLQEFTKKRSFGTKNSSQTTRYVLENFIIKCSLLLSDMMKYSFESSQCNENKR